MVSRRIVWAATTKDTDYIRMEGMKRAISDNAHRKEIVAGGMWRYMITGKRFFSCLLDAIADLSQNIVMRLHALLTELGIFSRPLRPIGPGIGSHWRLFSKIPSESFHRYVDHKFRT